MRSLQYLKSQPTHLITMKFQVTEIEYDFEMEDDEFPSQDYQDAVIEETLQKVWEVDDEEELTDAITDCFGWCIKSLDYTVLS
jgi:hypothetical protein